MKTIITTMLLLAISITTNCQTSSNMKTPTNMSTEIIRYKVSESDRETFINAYTAAAKHLEASKYCMGYELIQGEEEPDNFIVVIYWTSKDDHLNGFRKSAEFGPFFNLVKPFYSNIEEMKHYNSKFKWTKN
jgi:quinol monooxygenase YgiN